AGPRPETAATLALAPARQVSAKCLDVELRPLRETFLIFQRAVAALQLEPSKKPRSQRTIVFDENGIRRVHCCPTPEAAGFAVFFVVKIARKNEPAVPGYIQNKTRAASVQIVVAVGLADAFLLPVIIVKKVTKRADSAVYL